MYSEYGHGRTYRQRLREAEERTAWTARDVMELVTFITIMLAGTIAIISEPFITV